MLYIFNLHLKICHFVCFNIAEVTIKQFVVEEYYMNLRKMQITDYKKIYTLWLSCKGMGLNNIDDSQEGIERFLRRNPNTCFVAEESDNIIGVIIAGNDGRRGYIYHTAVSYSERHRGTGAKLVSRVLEAFEDEEIVKVALVVFNKNEDGNSFWEKQGFTARNDLIYRNKVLTEIVRIDT